MKQTIVAYVNATLIHSLNQPAMRVKFLGKGNIGSI